ncbi:Mitochondrial-processing peptidase subunit alpha [Cytospora mali]|uniref:Alpha-MPP n=1 Tax=Cytospora mali TaxID=578113 RepID=A0A194URR3_CYTMA|nr:Mitochondrial-processing peptidase subunit alpha [Valsa mali var. pyri (nom. inval.)]
MLRSCSSRLPARLRPLGLARSHNVRPSFRTRTLATVAPPPVGREPTELNDVTTLSNGIRVATESLPDAFSGVGVYIDAGSRESMMYQAATFNNAIPAAVGLLAETIRDPRLTEEEIQQQLLTAEYEITEIWAKPELILPELVHTAAFKDNTLGHPLLCPQERIDVIDKNVIDAYRDAFYRPERMVVAFAGVPHEEAVKLAEQHFGGMKGTELPAISETGSETSAGSETSSESGDSVASSLSSVPSTSSSQQSSKLFSKIPFLKNLSTSATQRASVLSSPLTSDDLHRPAHYTGGFLSLPAQPPSPNPMMPAFTHIHLAFEGLPISSDDIYALATLQTLLGGGGSFSAGGPGKGMYSRLYTNVLNQYGWVESCVAFNHSYTDSGLFGIAASCYPGRTAKMLDVMCRELRALALDSGFSALGEVEVARAKNQLRSSLLMNLESRMVELEDLGRQVQIHGRKVPVHEMTRKISELTIKDLRRVASMVVGGMVNNPGKGSGAPTVVLQEAQAPGISAKTLSWGEIQDMIYRSRLGRRS